MSRSWRPDSWARIALIPVSRRSRRPVAVREPRARTAPRTGRRSMARYSTAAPTPAIASKLWVPVSKRVVGGSQLVGGQRREHLGPSVQRAGMRAVPLVGRRHEEVGAQLARRRWARAGTYATASTNAQAPTAWASSTISADRVDRPDRVRGIAHGHEPGPRSELRLEIVQVEGDVADVGCRRVRTTRPRSRAIACHGPTFASWSRVVTTISSPGARAAPIDRLTWKVRVVMFGPNLISSGEAGAVQVGDRPPGRLDDRVAAFARGERPAAGSRSSVGSSRRRRR